MMKKTLLTVLLFLLVVLTPRRGVADTTVSVQESSQRATFALVIGSNVSVDANLTPLRYADDDAARYLDFFRLLGARTYLLARLDDNTKRLHPQAAAEATDPKKSSFDTAIAQLIADVTKASQRKVETVVYFVYAGHGNVANGQGYITLEDLRITGADLAGIFAKVPATKIHVIADACASYFLAYSRGPGGERRPIDGGFGVGTLASDSRVGFLLSTSSARESHEWDAFQSGVFSHEVRSGLYGAADADGDGTISYREIAAFISRANASIPNERYRPDIHARSPHGGDVLIDLRHVSGRRLEIDGKHAGRYFLEDSRGVRIADIHTAEGQSLSLLRPAPAGRTYLRRLGDGKEFIIESKNEIIALADLKPDEPRYSVRGAAHDSFTALFALPFNKDVVASYPQTEEAPPPPQVAEMQQQTMKHAAASESWRLPVGVGALGLGAIALVSGAYLTISSTNARAEYDLRHVGTSQIQIQRKNDEIQNDQVMAGLLYGTAVAFVGTGLAVLLWPSSKPAAATNLRAGATPGGGFVGYGSSF